MTRPFTPNGTNIPYLLGGPSAPIMGNQKDRIEGMPHLIGGTSVPTMTDRKDRIEGMPHLIGGPSVPIMGNQKDRIESMPHLIGGPSVPIMTDRKELWLACFSTIGAHTSSVGLSRLVIILRGIGSILALALTLSVALSDGSNTDGPPIGSSAPPFCLPDTSGKLVRLNDYHGDIVVLNFWAFWCDTWKAEMPSLRDLSGEQGNLGFRLVAISVDGTRVAEFQEHAGGHVPFPVLLDATRQASTAYNIAHVPTVVIIDRAGRVRYTAYGYPGNHAVLMEVRRLESQQVQPRQ